MQQQQQESTGEKRQGLVINNCAVLLSTFPLTCTSKKGTQSNGVLLKGTKKGAGQESGSPKSARSLSGLLTGSTNPPVSSTPNSGADLQWMSRTFIDEVNDDLVVISGGEVFFSKAALVADPDAAKGPSEIEPEKMHQQGSGDDNDDEDYQTPQRGTHHAPLAVDEDSSFAPRYVDGAHLHTNARIVIAAARCTVSQHTLVAVMHDEYHLKFYQIPPSAHSRLSAAELEGGSPTGSSPPITLASPKSHSSAFAAYEASVKSGAFGSRTAAIRFFAWLPFQDPISASSSSSGASPSAVARPCLVVSEGGISIVAVTFGGNPLNSSASAICTIKTRCDLVQYHAEHRFLVVLNSTRPTSCKCFVVDRPTADGIRRLPEFPIEPIAQIPERSGAAGSPLATTAASNGGFVSVTTTTRQMLPGIILHRLLQPVALYGSMYIVDAVPALNQLHLYQWMVPPSAHAGAATDVPGTIKKKYVLTVCDEIWPIQLQVVDNLLLVHSKGRDRFCTVFDVRLHPPKPMVDQCCQEYIEKQNLGGAHLAPVCSLKSHKHGAAKQRRSNAASMVTSQHHEDPYAPAVDRDQGSGSWNIGSTVTHAASAAWNALWSAVSWGSGAAATSGVETTAFAGTSGGAVPVLPTMFPLPTKLMDLWHEPSGVPYSSAAGVDNEGEQREKTKTPPPRSSHNCSFATNVPSCQEQEELLQELEFYSGTRIPLALSRATGEVFLVLLQPVALASTFGDRCLSTQFLLNRTGRGGDTIPLQIREMTIQRDSLHILGVMFSMICQQSMEHAQRIDAERKLTMAGGTPRRRVPTPFGDPVQSRLSTAGHNLRRLHEVLPMSDIQQDAGIRNIFRYEDAVWPFRGPNIDLTLLKGIDNSPQHGGSASATVGIGSPHRERDWVIADASGRVIGSMTATAAGRPGGVIVENSSGGGEHCPRRILSVPPSSFDQRRMCGLILLPLLNYGNLLLLKESENGSSLLGDESSSRSETSSSAATSSPGAPPSTPATDFFQHFLFVLLEYCRTLRQHQQLFSPTLQSILIEVFAQLADLGLPQYYRLQQLLMYRAIDPDAAVAQKLIKLSEKYPPAFQHGLDMLFRLKQYSSIMEILLAYKLPLRAVNFAMEYNVQHLPTSEILRRAAEVDDAEQRQTMENKRSCGSADSGIVFFLAARTEDETNTAPLGTVRNTNSPGTFVAVYQLLQRYVTILSSGGRTSVSVSPGPPTQSPPVSPSSANLTPQERQQNLFLARAMKEEMEPYTKLYNERLSSMTSTLPFLF